MPSTLKARAAAPADATGHGRSHRGALPPASEWQSDRRPNRRLTGRRQSRSKAHRPLTSRAHGTCRAATPVSATSSTSTSRSSASSTEPAIALPASDCMSAETRWLAYTASSRAARVTMPIRSTSGRAVVQGRRRLLQKARHHSRTMGHCFPRD